MHICSSVYCQPVKNPVWVKIMKSCNKVSSKLLNPRLWQPEEELLKSTKILRRQCCLALLEACIIIIRDASGDGNVLGWWRWLSLQSWAWSGLLVKHYHHNQGASDDANDRNRDLRAPPTSCRYWSNKRKSSPGTYSATEITWKSGSDDHYHYYKILLTIRW